MPGAPLVVTTGCVASLFADELASLAPNVVVEAEKDKVADRVLEELGFAPESVSDDGLVISKPTTTLGASEASSSAKRLATQPVATTRGAPGISAALRTAFLVLASASHGAAYRTRSPGDDGDVAPG